MADSDRPKVGPADPETRRRKLREELDKPTRAEGVAPKPQMPAKPKKKKGGGGLLEALDPNEKRERRIGMEGKTLDEVVSEAVDSAPKRPIR